MNMYKEYLTELKNLTVYETEYGFILYRILEEGQLYIRDVYVKPEHRRNKKATKMYNELIEIAKKEYGSSSVIADVEPSNSNATESIKVILANGLRVVESSDDQILFLKEI